MRRAYLVFVGILLASCGGQSASPAPAPTQSATVAAVEDTSIPAVVSTSTPVSIVEATAVPTATAAPAPTNLPEVTSVPAGELAPTLTPLAFGRVLEVQNPLLEGDDVRAAQSRLLALGYTSLGVADGVYGLQSVVAVKAFQVRNGLDADGVLGPQTWARLFSPAPQVAEGAGPLVPIVDAESSWLIGASRDGRWIPGPDAGALMAGGEGYTLYMADGSSSAATGTQPGSILEPCELTLKVQLSPAATAGVAVGAGLNVRPQPVTAGRLDDPKLIASVAALLKSKGIAAPEVQITNVLLGDLDGDGNEEAVVAATRLKPVDGGGVSPDAAAGDYSLVAVIAAGREPVLVDGQFFPKAAEFSAPLQQRLLDLLDLNGDGRLDVVVASQYYEGNAVSIYTIADGKATESLVTGCGA